MILAEGLSQRQAAAEIGVSQPRVAKLLKEGHLTRDGAGRVSRESVEKAKLLFGPGRNKHRALTEDDLKSAGANMPEGLGSPPSDPGQTPRAGGHPPLDVTDLETWTVADWRQLELAESRKLREAAKAYSEVLDVQRKQGDLVERAAVRAAWESIATQIRERLLGLPVRAQQRLGLSEAQATQLDQLVRLIMEDFDRADGGAE